MPRVLLATLLAAVLLTGGCGDPAAPVADDERPHRERRPQRTPSAPPAAAPTSSAPAPTPSVRQRNPKGRIASSPLPVARAASPQAHLLDAERMPHLARGTTWRVAATGPESATPVGACQKTPLEDLGALDAVRRLLVGPDGSDMQAVQVVGRFADPKSAWRAHEVLVAWRDDCEQRLDRPTLDVGPMQPVALDTGAGGDYRSTYGRKRDRSAAGLGIVRQGHWLSLVELTATSEDYPTDRNPARRAVRRIARTFG